MSPEQSAVTAPHDPTTGEATPENVAFPEEELARVPAYLSQLSTSIVEAGIKQTRIGNADGVAVGLGSIAAIIEQALESHRQLRDRYLTEKAAWRASQSTELPAVPPATDGDANG